MKRLPYKEGSWFSLPLDEKGYALGVVSRMAPRGKIIVAHFFGPCRTDQPTLADSIGLRAEDAVKCLRVGDLGLISGEWKVLGCSDDWSREAWPVPPFIRRDELSSRAWKVTYCDDDPGTPINEERVPFETTGMERDALFGYKAAESAVARKLALPSA